jgi:hypothetical protein
MIPGNYGNVPAARGDLVTLRREQQLRENPAPRTVHSLTAFELRHELPAARRALAGMQGRPTWEVQVQASTVAQLRGRWAALCPGEPEPQ